MAERLKIGSPEWWDAAELGEWAFMAKVMGEVIDDKRADARPFPSYWPVALSIAEQNSLVGYRGAEKRHQMPQEGGQLPAEYARKDEAESAHVMRLLHTLGYAHVTCHYVVQVSDGNDMWLDALPTDRANVYVTRNGAVNGSVYAAARAKHGDSVRIIKRLSINFPGEA